jgi:hypothetical protein
VPDLPADSGDNTPPSGGPPSPAVPGSPVAAAGEGGSPAGAGNLPPQGAPAAQPVAAVGAQAKIREAAAKGVIPALTMLMNQSAQAFGATSQEFQAFHKAIGIMTKAFGKQQSNENTEALMKLWQQRQARPGAGPPGGQGAPGPGNLPAPPPGPIPRIAPT